MNAPEMHVMFRQYAQQMGMQNVRAILPEQIDLLLNTAQMDVINQIIKENIGITNDRIITDNSKIGQINALRTLYNVREIDMSPQPITISGAVAERVPVFTFSASDKNNGRMRLNNREDVAFPIESYLFLVDFSISYKKVVSNSGFNGDSANYVHPIFETNALETNYFPVRLIDDAYLADTLNDFVLKNRLRSPIIVIYNNGYTKYPMWDIYIDKFNKKGDKYTLEYDLVPYKLRVSYIAKPQDIKYADDVSDNQTQDCQLPEYLHIDLVKHAVDLYRIALSGSMMAAQQQEQNARQENMRNNYRNEGNA